MRAFQRSAAHTAIRPFGTAAAIASAKDHAWIALWAALLALPLLVRGPLPPDEIRYLSVAWEMWNRGDLVLPYLNGAPYTDKGPLLFWLMHAGWAVFGVNDWWPRLLPALFALAVVLLCRSLARVLWPNNPGVVALVPWVLLGSLAFAIYTQVLLVDLLLTSCTLLTVLGMARAERGEPLGWALAAAGTALGLLTKGPVMLLHVAGAALLAPWWRRKDGSFAASAWYSRVAAALAGGVALALVWGVFAIRSGGPEYGADVLMYQTAGRISGGFAHQRPFWFYVIVLPVLLFPWSAWPAAWKALRVAVRNGLPDHGWRLLCASFAPTLAVMSAIGVKQPHYVLPLVPLFALLIASALAARHPQRDSARVPVVLAVGATILMAALPFAVPERLAVEPWSPVALLVATVALLAFARGGRTDLVARRMAVLAPLLVLPFEIAFFTANRAAYDTSTAAAFVRTVQDAGQPIAYTRDYEGEFHFSGRLTKPLEVIGRDESAAAAWSQQHPDGYLIRYGDTPNPEAAYSQRLRGSWLSIERVRP